jgi:hypothetical protein
LVVRQRGQATFRKPATSGGMSVRSRSRVLIPCYGTGGGSARAPTRGRRASRRRIRTLTGGGAKTKLFGLRPQVRSVARRGMAQTTDIFHY